MAKNSDKKRTPRQGFRDFFAKPPSTGATFIIGIVVIFAASASATALSFLVEPIGNATTEVPKEAFIAGGLGLALGLLIAWLGTRQYYKLRMYAGDLQLEAAQVELARLNKASENLRRLDIYSDHLYNLLEALVIDELSLHDPATPDTEFAVCEAPAEYLSEATGFRYALSIWKEPSGDGEGIIDRAADFVRDNLSDKVGDQVANALPTSKFEIVAGRIPDKKAFAVRIASSWLKHNQYREDDEPSPDPDSPLSTRGADENHTNRRRRSKDLARFVYSAEAPYSGLSEGDIKAFGTHDYKSVRAISFRRSETIYYLVVLSKDDEAFTEAEDLYLLWLRRVLELDRVLSVIKTDKPATAV